MSVKDREDMEAELDRALRDAAQDLARRREQILALVRAQPVITLEQLADHVGINGEALEAFVETLHNLVGDRPLSVGAARRAALLIAAEEVWEGQLGPLLTTSEVRELLDVSRQRIDEMLRSQRLIGLTDSASRRRFPAFQFRDGRPNAQLVDAYWTVAASTESNWTAASWCTTPNDGLKGTSPTAWATLDADPEHLARIASRDAARLAQ